MSQNAEYVRKLAVIYQKFRLVGRELEELIDANTPALSDDLTEDNVHRLDKCSVVLKMAFKDIKRILRDHGLSRLKTEAHETYQIELTAKSPQGIDRPGPQHRGGEVR